MARRFFDPESLVWKPLGYFGELVILSLLWALCSIPLVTLGPATAALYDTTVHAVRRKENDPFSRFFATFRRELKEGILLTLLCAAAALLLALLTALVFRALPSLYERGAIVSLVELLLVFFFLGAASWVFPTLSRFSMGIGAIGAACLRLAPGHALRSAAMALLNAALIYLSARFVVPLMFGPALVSLLSSFLIEPVFLRYEQAQEAQNNADDGR